MLKWVINPDNLPTWIFPHYDKKLLIFAFLFTKGTYPMVNLHWIDIFTITLHIFGKNASKDLFLTKIEKFELCPLVLEHQQKWLLITVLINMSRLIDLMKLRVDDEPEPWEFRHTRTAMPDRGFTNWLLQKCTSISQDLQRNHVIRYRSSYHPNK